MSMFIPHTAHNPAIKAARVYLEEECTGTFMSDVEDHLIAGYVISTPDYFIMARPVKHDADPSLICDPLYHFPPDEEDCWHIWLAAGDWRKFWENDTRDFKWVSWEKRNKLKVYPMDRVIKKVMKCA
jgi:hypothetical protein